MSNIHPNRPQRKPKIVLFPTNVGKNQKLCPVRSQIYVLRYIHCRIPEEPLCVVDIIGVKLGGGPIGVVPGPPGGGAPGPPNGGIGCPPGGRAPGPPNGGIGGLPGGPWNCTGMLSFISHSSNSS